MLRFGATTATQRRTEIQHQEETAAQPAALSKSKKAYNPLILLFHGGILPAPYKLERCAAIRLAFFQVPLLPSSTDGLVVEYVAVSIL